MRCWFIRKMHLFLLLQHNLHLNRDCTGCQAEIFNHHLELESRDIYVPLLRAGNLSGVPTCCSPWNTMGNLQDPFASKEEVSLASKPPLRISALTFSDKWLIILLLHYGELQIDSRIDGMMPSHFSGSHHTCQPIIDTPLNALRSCLLKKPTEHSVE